MISPALNLIAEPGRRRATLDTAREIERRGFAGISVSSRQHVAKRRPRVGDRAHSVRHRHSADLCAIGRRVRAKTLPICMRFLAAGSSSASASPTHRPMSAWRSSQASRLATLFAAALQPKARRSPSQYRLRHRRAGAMDRCKIRVPRHRSGPDGGVLRSIPRVAKLTMPSRPLVASQARDAGASGPPSRRPLTGGCFLGCGNFRTGLGPQLLRTNC